MIKIFRVLLLLGFVVNTLFAVSIETTKSSYAKGESITVEVSGLPKTKNCHGKLKKKNDCSWVGLFYAYDESKSKNLLSYQYAGTDSTQTFTFDGLDDAIEYEARVFYKNNYNEKGFYNFKVIESNENKIQIKTNKDHYKVGESISVSFSGMPENSDDWVGVFYAYDGNKPEHVVFKKETNGKKEGTFSFPALNEAYEYEVRAFVNGSYYEEDYYPFDVIESDGSVVISEVMAENAHTVMDSDFSKFSDWIELYNSGNKSIDLSGYKLSDNKYVAKWTIPNGTVLAAKSYMIFWADDKDISLLEHHTNFKLKGKGEAVVLFDSSGSLVDLVEFDKQEADISYAKDGGTVGFSYPTPMEENWDISTQFVKSNAPQVSMQGGFYDGAISISLSSQNDAEIYYTTDGSYPTLGSILYTQPISIDKTTVLKVMSVQEGKFPSDRITHTYLINEKTTLPVVSISTDEKYLWDDMVGIYTDGVNGVQKVCGEGRANYMQEWKRPANIEYFDTAKSLGFNQEVDIKISGTCTRELAQKSLSIKANDIYGKDSINYKLFAEKDIDTFKSFKLRNSGQDWWKTMFRDAMIQQLVNKDDLDIDYQAYSPVIVFLNGEYWGIHNIREKKNEEYIANNHVGVNPDKVDILYGNAEVKEGKADAYEELINYIENNNLSYDTNYNNVVAKIDINNYIDYQIMQIYSANFDWPSNNIRYWKERKDGAKWRWMMDDQDAGFSLFDQENPEDFGLEHNTLAFATATDSENWRNEPWSTFLLRNLLENEGFKNTFVNRYNTLLKSTFKSENVISLIDQMKTVLEPEMPRHIETWGDAGADYTDINQWNSNIDVMINFADKRPAIAKGHLDEMFPE